MSNLPLVEPFAVPDINVSGIADIEDMGDGNYRFLLYTTRRNERIVVASIIMTEAAIIRGIMKSAQAIGVSLATSVGQLPRNGDTVN